MVGQERPARDIWQRTSARPRYPGNVAIDDFYAGSFGTGGDSRPPRVEVLRGTGGKNPYFKRGQFGYVVGVNTAGGMYFADKQDGELSEPGDVAFLVSKTADMRGGALWFSAEALRFTKIPADWKRDLPDEERVALDLFLSSGNGRHKDQIAELVPSAQRRGYLKTLATQLKAVRPR